MRSKRARDLTLVSVLLSPINSPAQAKAPFNLPNTQPTPHSVSFLDALNELRVESKPNKPFVAEVHQSLSFKRDDGSFYTAERVVTIARDVDGKLFEADRQDLAAKTFDRITMIDRTNMIVQTCSLPSWICYRRKTGPSHDTKQTAPSSVVLDKHHETTVTLEAKSLFETQGIHKQSGSADRPIGTTSTMYRYHHDFWEIPALGICESMNHYMRSGTFTITTKVQTLTRGAPDLVMFVVPANARIHELVLPSKE